MSMSNREVFRNHYIIELHNEVRLHASDYGYNLNQVPSVVDRMMVAIDNRTFNKDHKCRLCDRTIPAHSKALYTFSLCGEDQHRPQYGYQCPMSMYPYGYCNYEVEITNGTNP